MKVIQSTDFVDYTKEVCPHCQEQTLYIEFDEYDTETGEPTETGVHVHCKNERDSQHDRHDYMPYVFWMPLEMRAYAWCMQNIRIADHDDRERLADWNAGKPLPGGMYQ